MKRRLFCKNISILFIVLLVTFSAIAVSGHTRNISFKNDIYYSYFNFESSGDIVWDNDMTYTFAWYAIWDKVNNFDMTIADDFIFAHDTVINRMNWIGGYGDSDYQQGNFDWSIIFYDDDGTGDAAGAITEVFLFTPLQYEKVFLEDTGYEILYEYSVDFPESIFFEGNKKYWVSALGEGMSPPTSMVGLHDVQQLHSSVIGSNAMKIPYWTDFDADFCFQLFESKSNLSAVGNLSWVEIKPGSVVKGEFLLQNIGEESSLLDWEISEIPDWGMWIIEPEGGEDLTPEDGVLIVNITVLAPDKNNKDFIGHVTILNSQDNNDYEIIDVFLTTPYNQKNLFFYDKILALFHNALPVLKYIFGL